MKKKSLKFDFMEAMKAAQLAKLTRKEYQRRVNRWKEYLSDHKLDLYQVTNKDLLTYQKDLLQADRSRWTINSFTVAIRSFYKLARKAEMIQYDPTLGVHGLRTAQPTVPQMSLALRQLWWDWVMTLKPNAQAGFCAIFGAGLKVGEAANLRPSDVIFQDNRLYLDVRNSQFALDRRVLMMDQRAAQILYHYWKPLRQTTGALFKIKAKTFQWHAHHFARRYHLRFDCHMLRRDFAIRMCKRGISIPRLKKLLGHSSDLQTFYYSLAKDDGDDDIQPGFRLDDDDDPDAAK